MHCQRFILSISPFFIVVTVYIYSITHTNGDFVAQRWLVCTDGDENLIAFRVWPIKRDGSLKGRKPSLTFFPLVPSVKLEA
jgi:hypothetical protein